MSRVDYKREMEIRNKVVRLIGPRHRAIVPNFGASWVRKKVYRTLDLEVAASRHSVRGCARCRSVEGNDEGWPPSLLAWPFKNI